MGITLYAKITLIWFLYPFLLLFLFLMEHVVIDVGVALNGYINGLEIELVNTKLILAFHKLIFSRGKSDFDINRTVRRNYTFHLVESDRWISFDHCDSIPEMQRNITMEGYLFCLLSPYVHLLEIYESRENIVDLFAHDWISMYWNEDLLMVSMNSNFIFVTLIFTWLEMNIDSLLFSRP